ncbi:hypothetical protein, partial [uncultured Sphingomonas sp.]|uniref:hypothetical protein n=1 Tax=uncultured Sphingomonas sp. TaxID=158754 RepID=UPI00258CCA7D
MATPQDPADMAELTAGSPLSADDLTDAILQIGYHGRSVRVALPLSVLTVAVSIGLGAPVSGTLAAGDPTRYMFWASGARVPSGSLVTAATGTNVVMTKLTFGSPQYAIDHLRLHYSGFACTEGGNSPQETVLPGNAMAIGGVWVAVNGGAAVACAFGGAAGTNIASGATGIWTDDLAIAVPAESAVTVYTLYSTAVGEKQIPVHQVQRQRGERVWAADNAAALTALI